MHDVNNCNGEHGLEPPLNIIKLYQPLHLDRGDIHIELL